jgi:hypothetical protein
MPGSAAASREVLQRESGAGAVDLSTAIETYKRSESRMEDAARVRRAEGKVFYLVGGVWVDGAYREGGVEEKVAFGSEAYFELLKRLPALRPFFALGEKIVVRFDDVTYVVE